MGASIRVVLALAASMDATAAFRDHVRRLGITAAGVLVIGLLAIASLACAAASLWIYAIPHLGPAGAPLAVVGLLVAAGIATLVATR